MSLEGDLIKIRKRITDRMKNSDTEIPTISENEERALRQLARMYELAIKAKRAEADTKPKIVLNLEDVSVDDLQKLMREEPQK